ncbi:late embryogenesis abundant protein At1g64065 [Ziziphus jujuba]|uniref:Late embryogenesis abundant protein At1g64065 n=1 Tax=Ziziphus jujuba TaxID=326968 RepID=A0A6P3YTG0_ZIZJJ|nr:late embryogenesis abundant protein At1g64065 [Ziziphus jujuba]
MADKEAGTFVNEKELKRKKRIKLAIYIAIFVVFQVIVITAFSLTVLKAKTPKFRLSDIEIKTLTRNTSSSPSFEVDITTKVKVKNTNFGAYKYDNSTVAFSYQGSSVGQVAIQKGKAGWLTTKNIDGVAVKLNYQALTNMTAASYLDNELSTGVLTLNGNGKMTGKVELIWIMKKKKSAEMNCTIAINVQSQTIKSLECK